LPGLLGLFIGLYLLFLLISISFIDFATPLDQRILLPLFPAVLFLLFFGFNRPEKARVEMRLFRIGAIALFIVFSAVSIPRTLQAVIDTHENGLGYASKTWQESALIARIRSLPQTTPIYSNAYDAIQLLTSRLALRFPAKRSSRSNITNTNYSQELAAMAEQIRSHDGVLIFFSSVNRAYLPTPDELKSTFPLQLVLEAPDGAMYKLAATESH
jgi:hypothetical protein